VRVIGPSWYWARADVRRRRRAALGLAVLVALASVVPVTAAAAARRTGSSVDRMREELRPYHLDLQFEGEAPPPADTVERIEALPGVEIAAEGAVIFARPAGTDFTLMEVVGQGGLDPSVGVAFDRPRFRDGRMAEQADEVVISPSLADTLEVGVGDPFVLETLTPEGLWAALGGDVVGYEGPEVPLEIVGIGELPEELTAGPDSPRALYAVAPGFFERWGAEIGHFDGAFIVRLDDGIDGVPAFTEAARAEFADRGDLAVRASEEVARIDDAVQVQTIGLLVLAAVAALAGLLAAGQAVLRYVRAAGGDQAALAAIGMDRSGRFAAGACTALVPAGAGLLAGLAVAVVASRWFPTGAAGRIEPSPGAHVDVVVLGAGALLVLGVVVGAAVLGARLPRTGGVRPSRLAEAVTVTGAPPVVITGVRAALDPGRGSRAVPTRSALVAGVAGVAGVLAALVFASSLGRVLDTPERYGWAFDFQVTVGDLRTDDEAAEAAVPLVADDRFAGVTLARLDSIVVEGRRTAAFGLRPLRGDPAFTVVAGRLPATDGEVAMGATSLDALGKGIGDVVEAEGDDGSAVPLTVVGRVLVPTEENDDPADAAMMTAATLARMRTAGTGYPNLYVTLAEGADRAAAEEVAGQYGYVVNLVPPPVVTNLRGVDDTPRLLAAFLAVLGVAATAHAVLTAIRRRRPELAMLKTLGFERRQVALSVLVHAAVFATVGALAGIPLGLGVGMQAWRALAGAIGFADDIVVPAVVLVALVPVLVLLTVAVAALPARAAARVRPADALRAE
jgi:hypothetical protein